MTVLESQVDSYYDMLDSLEDTLYDYDLYFKESKIDRVMREKRNKAIGEEYELFDKMHHFDGTFSKSKSSL